LDTGDIHHELAMQFLSLAQKQGMTAPLLIAHRVIGNSLLPRGDFAAARAHYDRGIARYDPDEHQSLGLRFGQDVRVVMLSFRSVALWVLGYPEATLLG
jgi:hypothetical protein